MERNSAIKLIHGPDAVPPINQSVAGLSPADIFKILVMPSHLFARSVICLAGIVIIIAGLKAASPVFNILFISWMIAQTCSPLLSLMIRQRIPTAAALLITIGVMALVGLGVTSVLGYSLTTFIQSLPSYQVGIQGIFEKLMSTLRGTGIPVSAFPLNSFGFEHYLPAIKLLLGYVGAFVGNILLILLIASVLLFEFANSERRRHGLSIPENHLFSLVKKATKDVKSYVVIFGGTGFIQAIVFVALFMILGIDNAVMFGAIFFLMNFIPGIGPILSMIPPVMIGFLKNGWETALFIIIGFVIVHAIFDWIIKPKFINSVMDISLFLIFGSIIFWSWVLGPAGLILAVPLTLFIKTLLLELAKQPVHGKGTTEVS